MTVRDTLTRAIRMTGARAMDDDPSPEEMDAALTDFQLMLLALPQVTLTDVLISADYTAGENERITDTSGTATITRPATLVDSTTGLTRTPLNGAVIEIANATLPLRYTYVSELQSWMKFSGLALEDAQPFGPDHDEGLAAMLAVRLFPTLQQDSARQPSAMMTQMAADGRRAIRNRFRQTFTATTDPALLSWGQRRGCGML